MSYYSVKFLGTNTYIPSNTSSVVSLTSLVNMTELSVSVIEIAKDNRELEGDVEEAVGSVLNDINYFRKKLEIKIKELHWIDNDSTLESIFSVFACKYRYIEIGNDYPLKTKFHADNQAIDVVLTSYKNEPFAAWRLIDLGFKLRKP